MVIVWKLARFKGYLYKFIFLIKFFFQFLLIYKVYPHPNHLVHIN